MKLKLYGSIYENIDRELTIHYLEDDELKKRYEKIKPIIMIEGITYDMKEFSFTALSGQSYIWNRDEDKRNIIHKEDLEAIEDFVCFHEYGYYGLFKPSIHEVLAQLPEKSIKEADYFEIIESPVTRDDVFKYEDILNAGYHASVVRTYKKKERKIND